MTSLFSLKGKTALLTGGGRGIGAAIVAGLKDAGALVAVFEKDLPPDLPQHIRFYALNLENRSEIETGFGRFIDEFESIDILVNNAGITLPSSSTIYPQEYWYQTLDVNLSAVFFMCQLAGQQMIKQGKGGSIINVTSIGAAQGFPNNPAYGAAKGGVRQLTKALACEWGPYNIRVNNLAPGYTKTPMNRESWEDPKLRKARQACTLLNRWAEPEDMIGPVVFLASDASRYITGIDLHVDGGWLAKGI